MIFSSKNLIPAVAFAAVASVAAVAPAQALSFNNGPISGVDSSVKFTFMGASANFFNTGLDTFGVCVISGPACGSETALFTGIIPVGSTANFNFDSAKTYSLFLKVAKKYTLYSVDSLNTAFSGESFADFATVVDQVAFEDIAPLKKSDRDYNDYVVEYTDVPTPAAVLPIIGGLLGFASKRKRNGEEA